MELRDGDLRGLYKSDRGFFCGALSLPGMYNVPFCSVPEDTIFSVHDVGMYLDGDRVGADCAEIQRIWTFACQLEPHFHRGKKNDRRKKGVNVCAVVHVLLGLDKSGVLLLADIAALVHSNQQFRSVLLDLLSDQQPVDFNATVLALLTASNLQTAVVFAVWKLSRSDNLLVDALPDNISFQYSLGPVDEMDKKYVFMLYIDSPGYAGHFVLALPALDLPVAWVSLIICFSFSFSFFLCVCCVSRASVLLAMFTRMTFKSRWRRKQ